MARNRRRPSAEKENLALREKESDFGRETCAAHSVGRLPVYSSSSAGGVPIPPYRGRRFQPPRETHRVNRKILAREVRVIGDDGKQLGIMPTHIACRIAEEKGLDLVEVNPKGSPPVCKIIDHGRFKYEEAKKKRASKKKQTIVQVKEIKVRPKTDKHDLQVRVRSTLRFLSEGNKAKLVVQFRGR
ncbi:MAG: translation initiation factor IF-3, partial [Deltaproteobacteria bacterium]|nr:translation initiation factor IF-3 [Deltaproteobacteria bacterium]